MKIKLFIVSMALLYAIGSYGQSSQEKTAVKQVITQFADLTANQDATSLADILDPTFRVVMNQLFGSKEVMSMDRAAYLEKIQNKEFGGEERKVEIHSIDVNGKTAQAKVSFKGDAMTFTSYLNFVQVASGEWKLIQDLPTVM